MTTLNDFYKTDLVDDHVAGDVNKLIATSLRAEHANTETISATKTLTDGDTPFQILTASGADRDVRLAVLSVSNHPTLIYNKGASNSLVVKDNAGSTTFATLAPGEWAFLLSISGVAWKLAVYSNTNAGTNAGLTFWTAVPGSPTRTSNTTLEVTDTGNANKYDKLISKGTCLKWTESASVKQAMVISATYATNKVTVTIIGDTMASIDANSLKYGAEKAREVNWAVAGTIGATGTDVAGHFYAPMEMKIFGADIRLGTAGNGTTTVDINDDGTTMFTTKPSITTTNTSDLDNTADSGTVAAEDSKLTIDLDAVAGTAGVDLYVKLFWTPNLNQHLT
ncbi:MAG: hypothetical protein E6Q97_07930 [Desulfurellales bacterium]|nr:MAG: hypothetical protein E6Q97_07930 [Desulfurellales bacterium]